MQLLRVVRVEGRGEVSVNVAPDPKPEGRRVASRDQWTEIVAEKVGPCRGCGKEYGPGDSFHHLVPKSLRGDDVASNIIVLCGDGTRGCHGALENHTGAWEEIAHAVRHSLTPLELQYVIAKKSRAFLDRMYPAGDTVLCARCKRPVRSQGPREAPRKRKRWQISVPDDAEDGAEILDTLVEEARKRLAPVLGWNADVGAFYVLSAVLADWLSKP